MKGPKIHYSCKDCEHLIFRGYYNNCKLLSPNISILLDYKTPDKCPYLIPKQRKEKLVKLKNSEHE